MGWYEAGERIRKAVETVITQKQVTVDLAGQIPGATRISCSAFGDLVGQAL
jgi:isocitrate dehydrogenase